MPYIDKTLVRFSALHRVTQSAPWVLMGHPRVKYAGWRPQDSETAVERVLVSALTPRTFWERYVALRRPVVLIGDLGLGQLRKLSDTTYLRKQAAYEKVCSRSQTRSCARCFHFVFIIADACFHKIHRILRYVHGCNLRLRDPVWISFLRLPVVTEAGGLTLCLCSAGSC